jgi:ribosomal protein L2
MYHLSDNVIKLKNKLDLMSSKFFIKQDFSLVKSLPRNKPISLLEPLPGTGIKYVRSPGSAASITKMDFRTSTALIKLPSGVRKVFSVFSLGSLGQNPLSNNRY